MSYEEDYNIIFFLLSVSTASVERISLTQGGNVLIGSTTETSGAGSATTAAAIAACVSGVTGAPVAASTTATAA